MATVERFSGFVQDTDPNFLGQDLYIEGVKVVLDNNREYYFSAAHTVIRRISANLFTFVSQLSVPRIYTLNVDTSTAADPALQNAQIENWLTVQAPVQQTVATTPLAFTAGGFQPVNFTIGTSATQDITVNDIALFSYSFASPIVIIKPLSSTDFILRVACYTQSTSPSGNIAASIIYTTNLPTHTAITTAIALTAISTAGIAIQQEVEINIS